MIRLRTVDLIEADVRLLPGDFVGIPVVFKAISHHFDRCGLPASDVRHAFRSDVDRPIDDSGQRISLGTVTLDRYNSGKISSTVSRNSGST